MTPTKVAQRQVAALDAAERLGLSAGERRRLSAAQAVQVLAHRIGRELAASCGITEDEIHDWGNANRDRRGPHLKLVQLTERALEEGLDRRRAFVLVDWVEHQLGRVAVELPRNAAELSAHDVPVGCREFADACDALADVLDGAVSASDRERLRRELQDLLAWGHQTLAKLEATGVRA